MTKHSPVATCAFCDWQASHTGEDLIETTRFLRDRLILHVRDLHDSALVGRNPSFGTILHHGRKHNVLQVVRLHYGVPPS